MGRWQAGRPHLGASTPEVSCTKSRITTRRM